MTTIDKLGAQISIDYLRSLGDLKAIEPLLRTAPAIYIPTQPVVHSLQPWAIFRPPPNYSLGLRKVFLNQQIVPALEGIDVDEKKQNTFAMISCEDDDELEEKEILERLIVELKRLNSQLQFISEQAVQYATGPLDPTGELHEDDAKFHTIVENRKSAYSFLRRGKFRAALPYLEAVVAAEPKSLHDLQALGAIYVHVYRPEDAVLCLQKSLQIDPNDASSKLNLARAYFDLNLISEGIDAAMPLQNNEDRFIAQNATEMVEQYLAALPTTEL